MIKGNSKYREVIHKYLYIVLHKIMDDGHHTCLKSGWRITEAKWHVLVDECAIWMAKESGDFKWLYLIFDNQMQTHHPVIVHMDITWPLSILTMVIPPFLEPLA